MSEKTHIHTHLDKPGSFIAKVRSATYISTILNQLNATMLVNEKIYIPLFKEFTTGFTFKETHSQEGLLYIGNATLYVKLAYCFESHNVLFYFSLINLILERLLKKI